MIQSKQHSDVARYIGAHGFAQLLLWSAFYYLLPAISAQISTQSGWPVLHITMTYTAAFILWALSAPIAGMLIDAGYGLKMMRCGAACGAALLFAISLTTNMWIFSLLVVLMGLCMAATLYDPCFAIMLRKLKSDGPRAVASVTLIAGFATLVTFPLVIGLSAYIEWRQIIQVFALMAMAGLFLLPSDTGAENPSSLRIAANMPLTKAPILIAFSFGLVMLSHAILLFLLPVALSEESTNASLLALAILGPAQISGRIVWHYAGASLRPQNAAIYMFICLCAPASILLIVGTTPLALFTALSIQGACYGVHTILRPSLAQIYVATDQLGRSLGLIAMVGLLMMACGPALGGLIWSHTGLSGLLGTLLFLNCTAILLGLILRSAPPTEAQL